MKTFAKLVLLASVAFAIFSIAYGYDYGRLNRERSRAYGQPNEDRIRDRVAAEQNDLHDTVKAVSVPYFLVCLGFFVGVWRTTSRRKTAIVGVLICLLMLGWTMVLSDAASFDEVFLAWVAAAGILGFLQLTTLGSPPKSEVAGR